MQCTHTCGNHAQCTDILRVLYNTVSVCVEKQARTKQEHNANRLFLNVTQHSIKIDFTIMKLAIKIRVCILWTALFCGKLPVGLPVPCICTRQFSMYSYSSKNVRDRSRCLKLKNKNPKVRLCGLAPGLLVVK